VGPLFLGYGPAPCYRVAEIALEHGFELLCVFPFARAEYEKDFAFDDSGARFAALSARAASPPLVLDGRRGHVTSIGNLNGRGARPKGLRAERSRAVIAHRVRGFIARL